VTLWDDTTAAALAGPARDKGALQFSIGTAPIALPLARGGGPPS
jgi:hypothetical protein